MDFRFDEDTEHYRQAVRRWAAAELAAHYQADDRAGRMRADLVPALAAMGLTGLRLAEDYGGQGASAVTAGAVVEEIGRADFNAAYVVIVTTLVGDVLARRASAEQRARWLPPVAEGSRIPCIAITEPGHGTDAANLRLAAEPDGDGWRLVGEKTSITLGLQAHDCLVLARTGGPGARGVSAFFVPLDHPGVTRTGFDDLGGRSIGRAALHFDGVPVAREHLVGELGEGFVSVMEGFDYSRAIIGLACLGTAAVSLDETLQWCRDREAFGGPLGRLQGVAFPLAECATYLRGARHICIEALWRKDNGLEHSAEAAMAKLWAPKLAVEVIHRCLLTFGHLGYAADSPLGQRLRDVIGLEIGDGTEQVSKLVIARALLGRDFAP